MPEMKIPVSHVIRRQPDQTIVGEAKLRAGSKTHIINSFAAHFAEVEVDPDSGAVRVLRYIAAHDSGHIIHPEAARGQIIGGVVQGIGYALMEEISMDPDTGVPLTLNLDSFKIPNLIDLRPIEAVLIEQPDPIGPYGAKALGEPPLVPVAAAIANAVYDAAGVRIRELPITAEKVLRNLRAQKHGLRLLTHGKVENRDQIESDRFSRKSLIIAFYLPSIQGKFNRAPHGQRTKSTRNTALTSLMEKRLREIPKFGRVILYCACDQQEIADKAIMLRNQGYRNIGVMLEGYPGWVGLGYPVEESRP